MSGEIYMGRYVNKHRIPASAGMTILILVYILTLVSDMFQCSNY